MFQFIGGGANIHIYMTTCTFYMSMCLYILAFNVDFEMTYTKAINSILSNQEKRPRMIRNLLLKRAIIDAISFQRNVTEY